MFLSLENFHLVFTNGYDVNWVSGFGLVCIGIYQHSPSFWLQRGQIVRWRKHYVDTILEGRPWKGLGEDISWVQFRWAVESFDVMCCNDLDDPSPFDVHVLGS